MLKKYIKLLIILLVIPFIIENVNAITMENDNGYKLVIEDDASLLSDEEINKLTDEMYSLTEYGNIAFKSISNNYTSTDSYARNYYHELFSNQSGTLFLIDMYRRNIYIFSDGDNYRIINNDKAYIITDNIYRYASSEEYYECASEAFKEIGILLNGGKILEPMRYISNAVISITIAAFVTFIIAIINSRVKKAKDSDVLSFSKSSFSNSDFYARKTGTHMVYSPVSDSSSSSGGGGGSSGGGGGGGSSGGGGGHGF